MFNAIYGFPFGHLGTFRPYISGGIGAINMSADLIPLLDTNLINTNLTTFSASQSRFGGNVGVGGFGYVGKVGVRADIRWFKANSDNTLLGLDPSRIVQIPEALERSRKMPEEPPPLWDGHASERIAEVLARAQEKE